MKPTVLVVEDNKEIQGLYQDALGEEVVLLQAFTQESARRYFTENQPINCIIVDGNVPGVSGEASQSTVMLIVDLRASGYTGRIIASVGDPKDETAMMGAGCDEFHTKSDRGLLASLIKAINNRS